MDYIEQLNAEWDRMIQEIRDMTEANWRLVEESQEVIDAHNSDVELSRPETRVWKEDDYV